MANSTQLAVKAAPHVFLTEPLSGLGAWLAYFRGAEIPVLAETAETLEALRAQEDERDDVDAGSLSEVIENDPLMTLKLLSHVAAKRKPDAATSTETITSALLMVGIPPFFSNFGPQPTVQERLHAHPLALDGLRELLKRAERARVFALGFAVHRADLDAAAIQMAAFLHDFAEMLLWCHGPSLALKIQDAQRRDATLRSADIQRSVLNIELDDLRQALMKDWHLPELLVHISDGKHPDHPSVRNVLLAVRLARHTMRGWDNAALPDDIDDIAALLNASPRIALAFVHKIDQSECSE